MIYVTRHGQTNWNVQKKVMGRYDEPLNEIGFQQAKEVKTYLLNKKIDIIICSPLLRAKQTAQIINTHRNIPIVYDNRIIERDFGEFEGKQTKDFDFYGYWNYYKNEQYKSAENIQLFFGRIYEFLNDIINKYHKKNLLIVTHGGVSIPIACFFNSKIPQGSLAYANIALKNCQVASYPLEKKELKEERAEKIL